MNTWMRNPKLLRWRNGVLLVLTLSTFIIIYNMKIPTTLRWIERLRDVPDSCPSSISEQSITPLGNTKHFLVSAYMDQRVKGFDIRIIGIFKRDSIEPLYCSFCCEGVFNKTTPATILINRAHFGFPFGATYVLCKIPESCDASHVTVLTQPFTKNVSDPIWLPIRNKQSDKLKERKLNFTVCISTLFGNYNNVLQVAQSLEMYRLLGVNRVVIYNTSCGPELERLLQSYSQEGFVEMVPWPIDRFLNPSSGWLFSEHGGDLHYFGQIVTLNECVYRSMERSHYVLLNDIDEIIMPYKHDNLISLMNMLEPQHSNVGEFLIENHVFPKKHFDPSGRFHLPQWEKVPGSNILEHIYREEPDRKTYPPQKMIIQPRLVEQTSVHKVLKNFGQQYYMPPALCHAIHVRTTQRESLKLEDLHEDKRLWHFQEKLIPNVDKVLKRAGLIN
uniref:Glycosyltransferase family 92 protein n=1 Tax=Oryzias sinensis TaxID=183150 RepID=A0A8C7X397_9TELE